MRWQGQESAESALGQLQKADAGSTALDGWSLRTDASNTVEVHTRDEKLCLLSWGIKISTSIQAEEGAEGGQEAQPESCGSFAAAARLREIICVQVLTAQAALSREDVRQERLEQWGRGVLACSPDLQPLPVLSPRKARAHEPAHHR